MPTSTEGPTPRHNRDLYPIDEACARLGGISRPKIYDLIKTGQLRSRQIGRRRFVPADAIDAFCADDAAAS